MTKYHLLMNGQNFLIDMDGKIAKHGFYQHVFLEAESPEQAEQLAVQKMRDDEDLKALAKNPREDPPVIILDDLDELESFEGIDEETLTGTGKIYYREKKWWQFWK